MKPMYKPYELVMVLYYARAEGGTIRAIGQAMSFPTPEKTLMVRRIPGHPGTLEEIPLDRISKTSQSPRQVHYARVSGVGSFPVDMLRYDNAMPVNFKINVTGKPGWERDEVEVDPGFGFGDELIVAKVPLSPRGAVWTNARWASFLWGIEPVKTLRVDEGE